jgi:thiazole synthase ThiGH ThiG subunit
MARAFKMAVESASEAVAAGLPMRGDFAIATSPIASFLNAN